MKDTFLLTPRHGADILLLRRKKKEKFGSDKLNLKCSVTTESYQDFARISPETPLPLLSRAQVEDSLIIFTQAPARSRRGWLVDFQRLLGWARRARLALVREF